MRKLALSALLLWTPVQAQPAEGEVLLRAMKDELARTTERLRMDSFAGPYFVAYRVEDSRRLNLTSRFGGLLDPNVSKRRLLSVELRVGSKAFDNMNYIGRDYWNYDPLTASLVVDDDYDALRFGMWQASDRAYKLALERLSQKQAYKQNKMIKEEIADLSDDPVAKNARRLPETPFDRADWERRLRKLSAIFRKYPKLQNSGVDLAWTERTQTLVDSEGREIVQPKHDFELQMFAHTQAADGMYQSDTRSFIRQNLDQMPPFAMLEAAVVELAESVTAMTDAEMPEEPYLGPVLFEEQAAGEFFNQLLAHNLSFPREIWLEDEWTKKLFHTGELTNRLGLRVIAPMFDVTDDPSLKEIDGMPLIGGYAYDDEGVAAKPLRLIERGILKEILMSRAPTKKRSGSNGRGRATLYQFPSAHISNLIVSTPKTTPLGEMKKRLLESAAEFGLDHAVIVRRMGGEGNQEDDDLLAPPAAAFKVDVKTGRETPLRNVKFSGVTLRALRDITAASDRRYVHNFYQLSPNKSGRGQNQASIVHPAVLVSEMEIKRSDKKPDKRPYLDHPYFSK